MSMYYVLGIVLGTGNYNTGARAVSCIALDDSFSGKIDKQINKLKIVR